MPLKPLIIKEGDSPTSDEDIPETYELINIIPDTTLPPARPAGTVSEKQRPLPDPDVYDLPIEWFPGEDTELVPIDTSALDIEPSSRRHRRALMRSRHDDVKGTGTYYRDTEPINANNVNIIVESLEKKVLQETSPVKNTRRPNITKHNPNAVCSPKKKISIQEKKKIEKIKKLFNIYDCGPPPQTDVLWYLKEMLIYKRLVQRTLPFLDSENLHKYNKKINTI